MNEFLKIVLSLSVSGTLLLLLIWGLKQLCKNKFSRRWQYYIWLVAVLRFLIPFTFGTTIVGGLFETLDATMETAASNENSMNPNVPVTVNTDTGETEPIPENRNATAADSIRKPLDIFDCVFLIWAVLGLILFVRRITIYQSFIHYLKAGNTEVADISILNLLSDCEEKQNIKSRVELYRNPLIASPMLIGFFRPCIILPVRELGEKELAYILGHELSHYQQKDLFYKWMIQLVVCVHWFNPFVYLLEKEVNKSCELSCDEKVISRLDAQARREYGDTLISYLKGNNLYKSSLSCVTLTEGAEQLKERLGAIMKFKKKSKSVIMITAIISVAVFACFFATGAYAAPSANHDSAMVNHNSAMIWKDSSILNQVMKEDGVYYIFCDGTGEKDRPQASVSDGSVLFVLVREDSYVSIGPFDNQETLVEDVTKQCEYMKSLTQEEKDLIIATAVTVDSNLGYSDSYAKLIAYKTGNYGQQSIADFNAALAPTPDALSQVLAAQADVISFITPDDKNYDFFTITMTLSAGELYCEHRGEEFTFFAGISKQSGPSKWLDEEGEIWYEFNCYADLYVTYVINAPELLTVAERDYTLLTFKEKMQDYLNGLSEDEITDGNIEKKLTDKAAELAKDLSTENMTLSCEIPLIDIID